MYNTRYSIAPSEWHPRFSRQNSLRIKSKCTFEGGGSKTVKVYTTRRNPGIRDCATYFEVRRAEHVLDHDNLQPPLGRARIIVLRPGQSLFRRCSRHLKRGR